MTEVSDCSAVSGDGSPEPAVHTDSLGMSVEEMRRLGHKVVDMIVERFASQDGDPVTITGRAERLDAVLGGSIPNLPCRADDVLSCIVDDVLRHQQRGDHPRYFARVPGPSSFAGILGDWLATGANSMVASWDGGSGPATIELTVLRWLGELVGLPSQTEGILVSGGSIASLTAFAAAREAHGLGTVYVTDQTHASLYRALRLLGFSECQLRRVPTDRACRMQSQSLRDAIREDVSHGRRPVMVIASAGTTNTGAIDPLNTIADICAAHNLWFHVDGAYGAPAAFCESARPRFRGIERADSLVIDPHKWLFQPYDIGCVLISRAGLLEKAFSMTPEYLRDLDNGTSEHVEFRNRGPELTRRARGIKLWTTIRIHGMDHIRAAIQRGMDLAEFAEQLLRSDPDWQIVTPAQLGIVTFRSTTVPFDHASRARKLFESGFAVVTSTEVLGQSVLRMCTINPGTTELDIVRTLQRLKSHPAE